MKRATFLIAFVFFMATAFGGVNDSLNNMKKRLPKLVQLKKAKAIGEDNAGYVAVLKNAPGAAALVAAENGDRKVVYASIAKKHGISPAQVGKQRAASIHQKAAPGTMIQDASGKWKSK